MHVHVYVCSIHLHLYGGKIYRVLIMIPRHLISYKHLFIVDSSSPSHSCILQRVFYGGWWIPKERQARSSLHIDIIISNLNGRKYKIWKYFQLDTLVTQKLNKANVDRLISDFYKKQIWLFFVLQNGWSGSTPRSWRVTWKLPGTDCQANTASVKHSGDYMSVYFIVLHVFSFCRKGFSLALGALPKFFLQGQLEVVFTSLFEAAEIKEKEKKWVEARRDAIKAITK